MIYTAGPGLSMPYFSTNRRSPGATFSEAVLRGQPDDRGLYFPEEVARLPVEVLSSFSSLPNAEIAFEAVRPFVDGEIDDGSLRQICTETVDFEIPLVPVTGSISILELFHGPTLAFKDIGARFMSRCLGHLSRAKGQKTTVIVATSGDTGGAVGAAFEGVEGVEVVIIFPKGKVSRVQELQLTTLGDNVTTLELQGVFDDCQALAKQALADPDLRSRAALTSANSINVARWLSQQFYYFFALKQWDGPPPVISVPSGNFGNVAAGLLAARAGLRVDKFVAACNANDVVPRFLESGNYDPHASVGTLSNAMDVGAPSNWARVTELCSNDRARISEAMTAVSVSDRETVDTIRDVYERCGYILDPHAAVGYKALSDHLAGHPDKKGIVLGTAHPIKFDSVAEILGIKMPVPAGVAELERKARNSIEVENEYDRIKEIILSKI